MSGVVVVGGGPTGVELAGALGEISRHTVARDFRRIDPTHARIADDRYITLAVGRDYADIRPVSGTYRGAPTRSLRVDVCVREARTPVTASAP